VVSYIRGYTIHIHAVFRTFISISFGYMAVISDDYKYRLIPASCPMCRPENSESRLVLVVLFSYLLLLALVVALSLQVYGYLSPELYLSDTGEPTAGLWVLRILFLLFSIAAIPVGVCSCAALALSDGRRSPSCKRMALEAVYWGYLFAMLVLCTMYTFKPNYTLIGQIGATGLDLNFILMLLDGFYVCCCCKRLNGREWWIVRR